MQQPITEKYKIWNTEDKIWFIPTYPGFKPGKNNSNVQTFVTEEIMFSQSGEMYLRTFDPKAGIDLLVHILPGENSKFIPCAYTGVKDRFEKKVYQNDVVQSHIMGKGKVVFIDGCWCIEWNGHDMRTCVVFYILNQRVGFEVIGNILEFPNLL